MNSIKEYILRKWYKLKIKRLYRKTEILSMMSQLRKSKRLRKEVNTLLDKCMSNQTKDYEDELIAAWGIKSNPSPNYPTSAMEEIQKQEWFQLYYKIGWVCKKKNLI